MATRALLRLNDATNKCFLANFQNHRKNLQSPNSLRIVRTFKRDRIIDNEKPAVSIFTNETGGPMRLRFWKTFGFTVAISGASIVGAAVWEYEKIRSKANNFIHTLRRGQVPKRGFRAEAHNWWRSLSPETKVFAPICFLNVLVFVAWKIPAFSKAMNLYFTTNPAARVVGLPMLLSTFSHYSFWHIATNMYCLYNISAPAVHKLGPEQFVAMYLISGVFGNFASHLYKIFLNRPGQSLGASGSIMGVLGYTCTQFPAIDLCIVFLPMFTFSAAQVFKAIVAMDITGAVLRWKVFDHLAHLGGAFIGALWEKWGNKNIWEKRTPLLMSWHKFREGSGMRRE